MSITMQLLPDVSAMRELYSSRFRLTIYSWQVVFQLTVPRYYSSTGTELCCLCPLSRLKSLWPRTWPQNKKVSCATERNQSTPSRPPAGSGRSPTPLRRACTHTCPPSHVYPHTVDINSPRLSSFGKKSLNVFALSNRAGIW